MCNGENVNNYPWLKSCMNILLYPELDGKRSGTPVLTEQLVTEGCWLRLIWTLKNYIHESNSTLGVMNKRIIAA